MITELDENQYKLVDGHGICSVPVWRGWHPNGFCKNAAYGKPLKKGRYVPGLACPDHGGPKLKDVSHRGDPCIHCGTHHNDVEPGPCPSFGAPRKEDDNASI